MSPRRGGEVDYRPAGPDDLAACCEVWSAAIGDYIGRLNQPWFSGDFAPLQRLLGHLLQTDPDRFWVAIDRDDPGRVIGFVTANLRGSTWFLSMLFVLPGFQAHGIGRALLERAMPHGDNRRDGLAFGTATDSAQPISNALYGQFGIVPRMPAFQFVGYPSRLDELARLPAGVVPSVVERAPVAHGAVDGAAAGVAPAELASVDLALLGYERAADHAWLAGEGRRLFVYRDGGRVVGYAYAAPSGRFGPIAALEAALVAPIAVHLLQSIRAPGAYATWVPGEASGLFRTLLAAGLRIEGFPALLCWTSPIADFSRYVPISLALV